MAIFLTISIIFAILTYLASVPTEKISWTRPVPKSSLLKILLLILAVVICVFFVVSIIYPVLKDPRAFYYALEIRGPFHAEFLWTHKAMLTEIIGGAIAGFFVGHWLASLKEQPHVHPTGRREIFPIAVIAIIVLAIHPGRPLTRIMDRITGVELLSGKFEFASPRDRRDDLGTQSIGSSIVTQGDIVPGANSVDFLVIGFDAILNTYRLMRNGSTNRDFLENNPWSEGSAAQFRRMLLESSNDRVENSKTFLSINKGALFVYKFVLPLAEC